MKFDLFPSESEPLARQLVYEIWCLVSILRTQLLFFCLSWLADACLSLMCLQACSRKGLKCNMNWRSELGKTWLPSWANSCWNSDSIEGSSSITLNKFSSKTFTFNYQTSAVTGSTQTSPPDMAGEFEYLPTELNPWLFTNLLKASTGFLERMAMISSWLREMLDEEWWSKR